MSKDNRDDFTEKTKRLLKDRVASLCSKPECRIFTVGANDDNNKTTNIGVAAHITAAASGGPRYDSSLTSQQRKSAYNGIWLCQNHAKEIDADEQRYPVELLQDWKKQAEQHAKLQVGKSANTQTATPIALTQPPLYTTTFIGRDDDLKAVRDTLTNKENLLLLVNGEGGIGKTTLASHYYHQYKNHYNHLAWVFADSNLADALLTLAPTLKVKFEPTADSQQRLKQLIIAMANLSAPNLLIIDNANNIDALKAHYNLLSRLTNFDILLTTRVNEFSQAPRYAITQLSQPHAKTLFTTHHPKHNDADDPTLFAIFTAVGYNTLVIELLAKNLKEQNRLRQAYSLKQLLTDLQSQGLLALSHSKAVDTDYQANAYQLRQETPAAIIAAMYNLNALNDDEKQLLSIFALLPAEHISFNSLEDLKVLQSADKLEDTLISLHQQGWLEFEQHNNQASYRTSPVIQAVVRKQNEGLLNQHSESLVDILIDKLEYQGAIGHLIHISYDTAALYSRYAAHLILIIGANEYDHGVLLERIGSYHQTTGDITRALDFYQQDLAVSEQFRQQNPDNAQFTRGLAIAYSKLGDTHTTLDDSEKALEFYEKDTLLSKQLYDQQSRNAEFTSGLAIAYLKLGDTHTTLVDIDEALEFYEKHKNLCKQLYDQQPNNVEFTNGLAIAYEKLGNTHISLSDTNKALEFYEQRATLGKQLYDQQPQNVEFTYGLAIAYEKLGNTHTALGDFNKALNFYEKDIQLSKQLYSQQPKNVQFTNGLAISYAKLGQFYQQDNPQHHNLNTARDYFTQAQQLWLQLTKDAPAFAQFQRNLQNIEKDLQQLNS